MRLRLILIGVVMVLLIVLGLPYMSWQGIEDNPDDMTMTLHATAYCNAYAQKAVFTHATSYSDMGKPSYTDYIGEYWSGIMPGSAVPSYPLFYVLVQIGLDTSTRQTWEVGYTYGETLVWDSDGYVAPHGATLRFQMQIYYSQSYGSYISWTETVP